MRWFRFYGEVVNDPKVQLLPIATRWRWVELLCLASETKGKLPSISHVAYLTKVSVCDAQATIDELIMAGLIDIQPDKSLVMHNWSRRQYESDDSKGRVRKHRTAKNDNDRYMTVTVTPPEAEAELDTDSEPVATARVKRDERDVGKTLKSILKGGIGAEASEVRDHTRKRAEGLGLPVEEIMREAREGEPDNLDAYFQAICRRRLKAMLPGIHDDVLRKAFGRDGKAYAAVLSMMAMQ